MEVNDGLQEKGEEVMPLSKTGKEVMSSMKGQYGSKEGESIFYATMNKKGMKGEWENKKAAMKRSYEKD